LSDFKFTKNIAIAKKIFIRKINKKIHYFLWLSNRIEGNIK
jgi:hypothetical protein